MLNQYNLRSKTIKKEAKQSVQPFFSSSFNPFVYSDAKANVLKTMTDAEEKYSETEWQESSYHDVPSAYADSMDWTSSETQENHTQDFDPLIDLPNVYGSFSKDQDLGSFFTFWIDDKPHLASERFGLKDNMAISCYNLTPSQNTNDYIEMPYGNYQGSRDSLPSSETENMELDNPFFYNAGLSNYPDSFDCVDEEKALSSPVFKKFRF